MPKDYTEKFLKRVDTNAGPEGCWPWTGHRSTGGYGRVGAKGFGLDRWYELAHRLSYILFVGAIPDGKYVCHRCDNPPCVNPRHLFIGDGKINSSDRAEKGRNANRKGSRNTHAKLTEGMVRYILESPHSGRTVAARWGIAESTVSQIRSRKLWPHVKCTQPVRDIPVLRRFFDGLEPTDEGHQLAKDYQSGKSRDFLAKKYRTTPTTITNTLEAMGVKRRSGGAPKRPLILNGKKYPGVLAAMRGESCGHAYVMSNAEFPE